MNTALLKHPMNWLTLWSMGLIIFFLGHLLISFFHGVHPGAPRGMMNGNGVTGPGTEDTTASATNN